MVFISYWKFTIYVVSINKYTIIYIISLFKITNCVILSDVIVDSCISCLRHFRKFMKSCNNDLNLKTQLPRYRKFDWSEMLYWAFWEDTGLKIFRVLLVRSHWHCWVWLTKRDVPNEPPPRA